jgi:hypothetical protein
MSIIESAFEPGTPWSCECSSPPLPWPTTAAGSRRSALARVASAYTADAMLADAHSIL